MLTNTNTWNRIRYTLYLPVYDLVAWWFRDWRRRSVKSLELNPGDKVLIIGAGSGLDLEFIPQGVEVHAVDITPAMISLLRVRARNSANTVKARVMDGSNLEYEDETFDAVVLHLILAVMPDPKGCLEETIRVLKPSGRFTILDKFLEPGKKPGRIRKIANLFSKVIATDINREITQMATTISGLKIMEHYRLVSIFWHITGRKEY